MNGTADPNNLIEDLGMGRDLGTGRDVMSENLN